MPISTSSGLPWEIEKRGAWLPAGASMTTCRGEVAARIQAGEAWAWAGLASDGGTLRRVVVQERGGRVVEGEIGPTDVVALAALRARSAGSTGAGAAPDSDSDEDEATAQAILEAGR